MSGGAASCRAEAAAIPPALPFQVVGIQMKALEFTAFSHILVCREVPPPSVGDAELRSGLRSARYFLSHTKEDSLFP